MGHYSKGSTTVQLGTRHLWQALLEPPPNNRGEGDSVQQEEASPRTGRGAWAKPFPCVNGTGTRSGICSVIGQPLQRASQLAPCKPLVFELGLGGFARAARGSEAGLCLSLRRIGRVLRQLENCLSNWCVLCTRVFFLPFQLRIRGPVGKVHSLVN